ncbi:MAG: preprotein translocase subunit SecG [Bacteroidetes bacterium]|nr:preprotein translocase subunit SecG [Bacteroidota bacterium]
MLILFGILVIIASVVLGLIVLIQNPKGGGLNASLGGFSNQLMGVKQTTDVLEKGTWIFAAVVGVLCLVSPAFIPKDAGRSSANDNLIKNATAPSPKATAPVTPTTTAPLPGTVQPQADTTKH